MTTSGPERLLSRLRRRLRPEAPPATVEHREWPAPGERPRSFDDPDRLARYIGGGISSVEGFADPVIPWVLAGLAHRQLEAGVVGSSIEIGVHRGQTLILLGLASTQEETVLGVDLFDDQAGNVDASGAGDRSMVEDNLRTWGLGDDRIRLLPGDSNDVTADELLAVVGALARLVHVDGGHTTETTLNDLRLADGCLHPDGLVFLDDVFHPGFPGVISGLRRFDEEHPDRLVPAGLVGNKAILSRPETRDAVYAALEDAGPGFFTRIEYFFGHLVRILLPGESTPNEWRAGWWPSD